jgi:hypothetical protein
MGRKDQRVAELLKTIRRLKEAPEKSKELWEDERIRCLLQQEEQKALNELYELLDKEE